MRAAISRVVHASPETVAERLTPRAVVEAEGRFAVKDVSVEGDRTVVTAWPSGHPFATRFAFEDRPDGFAYWRLSEARPFVTAETTVTLVPEGDGERTRVEVASEVETAVPLPLVERAAARRRRRDIERLVARLDEIVH
ncbi:SRPBCC family protein [Halosimplex pelagicum]|uniref:SRPBCC family protein n=1 Tax=Halosimplex pelagicum TaxID=869886 RepID=A0A7D5T827_9EURY|nr:SRPBCC family protein [Halosimplex pelagicum]QLH84548.1 SRPBCC family protein [Halosimplex pelagicum]